MSSKKSRKIGYREPYLQERIDQARKYAESVSRAEIKNEEDLRMVFRLVISGHYKIPIFDNYFKERTFDELAFESHLITMSKVSEEEKASNYVSDNLASINEAVDQAWSDLESSGPSEEEMAKMVEFMETGKFEGEE